MKMIKEERQIRNSGNGAAVRTSNSTGGGLNRSNTKEMSSPKNDQSDLSPGSRYEKLFRMINLMKKHK
jgi:hypothetical protein